MNLYLISQDVNNDYDTYDSAVVAAESKEDARKIHPADYEEGDEWFIKPRNRLGHGTWVDSPDEVKAELIGVASPGTNRGVILASFNAG